MEGRKRRWRRRDEWREEGRKQEEELMEVGREVRKVGAKLNGEREG